MAGLLDACRICSVYIIVASLLLAPLVAIDFGAWRSALAVVSASIAASAAALSHFEFHENWLRYRSTWDRLKREPSLRMAGLADYAQRADRNVLFVERVEAIMKLEGEHWHSEHAQAEDMAEGMTSGIDPDYQNESNGE